MRQDERGLLDEDRRLAQHAPHVLHLAVGEALRTLAARRHRLRSHHLQLHERARTASLAAHLKATRRGEGNALQNRRGETEGGDVMGGVEQLQLHVGKLGVEDVLRQTHWKIERIIPRLVGLARHRVNDSR